jgi:hypothetical protein
VEAPTSNTYVPIGTAPVAAWVAVLMAG